MSSKYTHWVIVQWSVRSLYPPFNSGGYRNKKS